MCGIFGYINFMCPKSRAEVISTLVQGLRRMEYRGYDSAGLAIDAGNDVEHRSNEIKVLRCQGKVDDLDAHIKAHNEDLDMDYMYNIHCGIAHTRWATHGQPSDVNSHPQRSDDSNAFVCVHNGIITNYRELKKFLLKKGARFESDTDSEVVVKLAKYIYDKYPQLTFPKIVEITISQLEGAFALAFKSSHFPGQIVATRKGSPLVLGLKCENAQNPVQFHVQMSQARAVRCDDTLVMESNTPTNLTPKSGRSLKLGEFSFINDMDTSFVFDHNIEYFFASDASAIVEHTKKVIYLQDDDIASVEAGQLTIHRVRNKMEMPSVRIVEELNLELDEIMRGEYKTFMQKEIFEQPESVVNTMRGRVLKDGQVVLGGIKDHLQVFAHNYRFVIVACGTSYNSAVACRMLIEELCGVPVQLELASDFMDRAVPISRSDVCVFISQSGETADTLAALRYCRQKEAFLLGITNTVGSSICRETDCGIHLNAGPEIGVASTKAYTSQIIALTLLAVSIAQSNGHKKERCDEIVNGLFALSENVSTVLKTDSQVLAVADHLYKENSILVMGRGFNFATCMEGALKIKELSYMHCEGILSGELKHGPLAMVDEEQSIVMVICSDNVYTKSLNALQQVMARGGKPIVIADTEVPDEDLAGVLEVIRVPKTVDCLQNVLTVIPLQLMSYHVADLNGFNVDRPRNLAKSVTVE